MCMLHSISLFPLLLKFGKLIIGKLNIQEINHSGNWIFRKLKFGKLKFGKLKLEKLKFGILIVYLFSDLNGGSLVPLVSLLLEPPVINTNVWYKFISKRTKGTLKNRPCCSPYFETLLIRWTNITRPAFPGYLPARLTAERSNRTAPSSEQMVFTSMSLPQSFGPVKSTDLRSGAVWWMFTELMGNMQSSFMSWN